MDNEHKNTDIETEHVPAEDTSLEASLPEGEQPLEAKPKRKMSTIKKAMLGLAIFLGVLVIIAGVIVIRFFSRMQRPGTIEFEDDDGMVYTPAPIITPSPTPSATPAPTLSEPTPTPLPTQEPGPLPLEELYTQTYLTGEELQKIADNNANTDVVNILVVGVDRRGTQGRANADVVMIATLDKKNNRLKLTSLLRDLYLPIPGHNAARLNSAAAKGGIPLLMQTVNEALRLNIQNYVMVDFSMFEKLVNKLGGVTVYMTSAEISAANDNIAGLNKQRGVDYLWDGFIFANAGNVRLTGKQALAYARIRKIDSDFKRTGRQFKVLTAIYAKFRSKPLTEQLSALDEILPYIETDIGAMQIVDYATQVFGMDVAGLLHISVPISGLYKNSKVDGSFVFLFDMPATALQVHEFIYYSTEEPDEAKVLSPGASLPPRTPSPATPTPDFYFPDAEEDDTVYRPAYIPQVSAEGAVPGD